MIDREEVLRIFEDYRVYEDENEVTYEKIIESEINNLPVKEHKDDFVKSAITITTKSMNQRLKDTELLKECYEILTGETQIMTDELMKSRIELFFKLKERLDINE